MRRKIRLVFVVDEEGNELARNTQLIKKIKKPHEITQREAPINDNEKTKADRKSYPKRNYRPVKNLLLSIKI